MRKTLIVVPCFNEADRLPREAFLSHLETDEETSFLFVDDGSTDGTARVCEGMKRAAPGRIDLLSLPGNVGKANAVREGLLRCFEEEPTFVGFWDADLAAPLSTIPVMREYFASEEIEVVLGSRVRLLGREIQRRAVRHYLGRIFATAVSLLFDLPVYDSQCGAKLFRNDERCARVFAPPFQVDWTFDVEIVARYLALARLEKADDGVRCFVEHPLHSWKDIPASKISGGDFLRSAVELARLGAYYRGPGAAARCERLLARA
jgi:glycosyltransferase involved in cell wall biosynthesis